MLIGQLMIKSVMKNCKKVTIYLWEIWKKWSVVHELPAGHIMLC